MKCENGREATKCGRRIAALLVLAMLLLVAMQAFGQERFGSITGVVYDVTKAVLPGAQVTIVNNETKKPFVTTSGDDGKYYARNLEPGRYSVTVEKEGFAKAEISDAILLLGKTFNLDVVMEVGHAEQTVEVTGTVTMIDTETTAVTHNVTSDEFMRMPKARSFQDVALTSPSVNSGEIEGGIQVNGASGAENNFNVDGISTTSLIDGTSRQNAMYEMLQEVQVKTSGLEAEYGGALGGVITAVTKSGGNAFHGEVHWYNSGSPFDATDALRLEIDPNDDTTTKYIQDKKTTDHINEIGYSVGGYIVKNKLYFFSFFAPQFEHLERNMFFDDGATQGLFTANQNSFNLFNKISWDPTSRIRTNFSWLYTSVKRTGMLPAYNSMSPNTTTNSISAYSTLPNQGWTIPQNSYTGTADFTLSNTAFLSVKGGYFWDNYKTFGAPSYNTINYAYSATDLPFVIPTNMQHSAGWVNVPISSVNPYDITTRAYFQADFSKNFRLIGSHTLKAGAGVQKNVNKVDVSSYQGGYLVTIYWNKAYTSPVTGVAGRGTYGYYRVRQIGTMGSAGSTIDNMYVQDQWQIIPRLTLSLGFRTERENIPSFDRSIQEYAMQFGWGDKLAPRLGASYDLFGNGKVKVFGHWGRYFDWTKYTLVRGSFGGDVWKEWYHALNTLDLTSLSLTNMPGANLWNADPKSYRDFRIPSFGANSIDPDIKPMHQDTTTFGVEYQLSTSTLISAHYIHSMLTRTIEDIGSILSDGSQIYPLGNPGEGRFVLETNHISNTPDFPMPKPKRQYDALELVFNRRFAKNWFLAANYTYSRLYGNYSGLSDTDEIAVGGWSTDQVAANSSLVARPGTNTSTYYDDEAYLLDANGKYLYGRLATDRPHVFKTYGSYTFKWGTQVSANFSARSGTPMTTTVEDDYWDVMMVNGRADAGRTPTLTQTDLMVSHTFKLGENKNLRFEFNITNLFNQKTVRHIDNLVNRSRDSSAEIDLSNVNLLEGFNWKQLLSETTYANGSTSFNPFANFAINPTYGLADLWQPGFSARFGVKFSF